MAELIGPRLYGCCNCLNIVCCHDDIMSKTFQARRGRAFLLSHAMNIDIGPKRESNLITGHHIIADIFCGDCKQLLRWKYEWADAQAQKYKEGKFIFEKVMIVKTNW